MTWIYQIENYHPDGLSSFKSQLSHRDESLTIHEALEPKEETFAFYVGENSKTRHESPRCPLLTLALTHESIEAEGDEEGHDHNDIELHIDTGSKLIGDIP